MSVPPLVPPEVDLRDFAYMPLDVLRLRDSDLSAEATAEEFRAAVMLWCAAWHQIPAASLADSDAALAKLAGFGRDIAGWQEVKEGALRGWIKCDDGRLYHPVVAEKANEAWEQKTKQRNRTAAARAVRMGRRNDGCYSAPDNSVTDNVTTPVTDNVTPSKGTERNGIELASANSRPSAQKPTPRSILLEVLSPETADGVIAHRKAKKCPLTDLAAKQLVKGFLSTGDPEAAALMMVARGWQGFKAEWFENDKSDGRITERNGQRKPTLAELERSFVSNLEAGRQRVDDWPRPALPARNCG